MVKKFLLKTKNMILKYLFKQPDLNFRKAKWLYFISKDHFKLKNIKGKENTIVDSLSRRAHMLYEVTLIQTDSYLHKRIIRAKRFDPFYVEILKKVQ